jgi:NAD(P)-dependent dehydrogenase (short-subunit alcohol dehydrogenase family)
MGFEGTVAVVVGSGRAIGRACALEFAKCGALVVAVDNVESDNQDTCEEIRSQGGRSENQIVSSLSNEADMAAVVASCGKLNLPIKVLVNAQTETDVSSIENSTIESWRRIFDSVVFSPVLWSKGFLPSLKKASGAAVVHVGSIDGIFGNPGLPAYSAAKGSIIPLTHVMAYEFGPYRIRVNCVARGSIEGAGTSQPPPAAYHDKVISATPLKRRGRTAEVAAAVRFLASDDASFISGTVLVVDGGRTGYTPATDGRLEAALGATR